MSDDIKQPLLPQMNFGSLYFGQDQHRPQHRVLAIFDEDADNLPPSAKPYYHPNVIVSSRYTLLNFLPKSLMEQFRRLANVYFLVIGIIASVGSYTSIYDTAVEPAGILAPMLIVVFISIIKDGVEDFKRHQSDQKINNRITHGMRPDGTIFTKLWKDIKVGDALVIFADEELPADVLVLMSGGVSGKCGFVETAAIDGETNLKLKVSSLATIHHSSGIEPELDLAPDRSKIVGNINSLRCSITAEPPNSSIHRFNGVIAPPRDDALVTESTKQVSLNEKNLMLRGSILRATEWCICTAVYTGADTKLSLNSKRPPSKLSSVDRIVNRTLVVAISCMICVCLISMLFSIAWMNDDNDATYLCLHSDDLDSRFPNGGGCESGYTSSYLRFFTFTTLYNNFVCISMYVSLEMVYICQSFFLCSDLQVYDESTDTPAECNSSGMCADLGQVQYILSDKTGTLTKNQMVVQCFSIAKRVYGQFNSANMEIDPSTLSGVESDTEFYATMDHVQSTIRRTTDSPADPAERTSRPSSSNGSIGGAKAVSGASAIGGPAASTAPFQMTTSGAAMKENERRHVLMFMRALVYCNTGMIMPGESGNSEEPIKSCPDLVERLQAESPDEVALITCAAQHCGVLLRTRTNNEIVCTGLGAYYQRPAAAANEERAEIIAMNEFDSDRKMMSIVVRITAADGDGPATTKTYLLCKGADSSILRHCRENKQGMYLEHCGAHINLFANTGLRTLAVAYRELEENELVPWLEVYSAAANTIVGRDEALQKAAEKIEKNMILVGALGIEDELQDGVPDAISIMHSAGLNVWMITGDKAETAIAIGKKCALLQPDKHHIERVLNLTDEPLRQQIMNLHSYVLSTKGRGPHGGQGAAHNQVAADDSRNSLHADTIRASVTRGSMSGQPDGELALIVDGISLEGLWASDDLKVKFIEIVQLVPIVIACRVSPLQKAALVRMVKSAPGNPVTLAIGDGANDVGMIHESRVGVGISGREGRHAANAADFAIAQFRFIVPLLFHHGRYNYVRCSKLVLYSFFKNLLLVSTLFYFCAYSGFSGTVPLNSLVFSGFNFYLGLPILALGAMDFDVPRSEVMKYPYEAYATGRLGEMLNIKNMARWCIFAFVQGLLLFVVTMRFVSGPTWVFPSGGYFRFDMYGTGMNDVSSGTDLGIYAGGLLMFTSIIFAMQYKVVAMSVTPTYIFWLAWLLSFCGYFVFIWLYGLFPSESWFNTAPHTFNQPLFWLAILIVPIFLVVSDYTMEIFWEKVDPSSRDMLVRKIREAERLTAAAAAAEKERGSNASGHSGIALSNCYSSNTSNPPADSSPPLHSSNMVTTSPMMSV